MALLSVSSKALAFIIFFYLLSLANTVEISGADAMESLKELQKRVDHLETLLISSAKEQAKKCEAKMSSRFEILESKYDSRIQQLEFRLDKALAFSSHSRANMELEPIINEVTSEFQATQNEEPVSNSTCSEFGEVLKISLRNFEDLVHSSMAKVEEDREILLEAVSKLSSIHSIVNSTWDELVDHRRNWNNVNKKNSLCKEGWHFFEDSCYYFSHTVGTWEYGRSQCLAMGGDYVKVSTNAEWNFIATHISSDSWIGLSDTEQEGTYKWISDGSIETEINKAWWHNHQPDNYRGVEHCIHYWVRDNKNLWNDYPCDVRIRYICEMEPEPESS